MNTSPITIVLLLGLLLPGVIDGQGQPEPEAAAVVAIKEYFVQQGGDEAIVVRVRAFEAEYSSRLSNAEGETLSVAGLPDARTLPLYQFVAEPGRPRQVDIDVSATQVTDRTEFELELIRLNVRDERSARLVSAYRYLSAGLETLPGGTVPDWTVKVQTLLRAEGLFAETGMEELRLWCRVYATHLVLHRLRDMQTTVDWAEGLLASPRIDRFPAIAFAASKLRSSALAASSPGSAAAGALDTPAQRAIGDTVQRAQALNYRYEEALALQAGGIELKDRGVATPALERFERALAIAEDIGSADLAAGVREHIVAIHEEFGDAEASGSVLQDIETHLLSTGESEELALNLLRQGRLHLSAYRYTEAIEALSRAAGLEQSALSRIEVDLALGTALNEAGRADEALPHLYRVVVQPDSGDFRRPGPAIDLFGALGDIAAIHRQQGESERMAEIRAVQEAYARDGRQAAEWAYQRAVDSLIRSGAASAATRDRFGLALNRSGAGAGSAWRGLALLRLCGLPSMVGSEDARCSVSATSRAFDDARSGGSNRQAAEAAMLYAQLLGLVGQTSRAYAIAEAQVDELLATGRAPLGAWYWQWRAALIENYLALAIRSGGQEASVSLLALARARLLERGEAVRQPPDNQAMQAFLSSLPPDSAVLTYFVTGSKGHGWVAGPSSVRRFDLDQSGQVISLCAAMRVSIQAGDWSEFDSLSDQLGSRLLRPVAEALPGTILLLGNGPLLGIPFDALSLDGTPLAERHRLINLDALPTASEPAASLRFNAPRSVFLAGDPQDWSGDYAVRLDASQEFRMVSDRFVGPGLHSVQGVALLLDEIDDERLAQADLVHLSIPGMADLSPARESVLFLSEPGRGEGRQRLTAGALSARQMRAGLVFLSRTEFTGTGTLLENDTGPVSAALEAGAGAVVATLWAVDDETRSRFISRFYDELERRSDAAAALAETKRTAMQGGNTPAWAAFQLFLD